MIFSTFKKYKKLKEEHLALQKEYDYFLSSMKNFLLSPLHLKYESKDKNLDHLSLKYIDFIQSYKSPHYYEYRYTERRIILESLQSMLISNNKNDVEIAKNILNKLNFFPKELINTFEEKYRRYYFGHGIDLMPVKVLDYIKGKVFIDAGAFDGESAIMLQYYKPSKTYSVEISPKNIVNVKKNLEKANLLNSVEIIDKPFLDKIETISFSDTNHVSTHLFNKTIQDLIVTVESMIFDEFIQGKGTVGFMKLDVENAELPMLKGSIETIKRDRPVLAISMYHSQDQFNNLKPFIESLNCDYNFMIRPLSIKHTFWSIISECTLLCYPKELEN